MNAPLTRTQTSEAMVTEVEAILEQLTAEELQSEMEDSHHGLTSLYYCGDMLKRISPTLNAPREFLDKYLRLLENRYFRLTDEDAGEYGSGRDALGYAITEVEKLRDQQ